MAADQQYDYVVVGSGAGGGPLACNLARAGFRVLLMEAGGTAETLTYQVPVFHTRSSEDEDTRWNFFVRHFKDEEKQRKDTKYSENEIALAEGGVLYPRAGTLGGCTAHHAMIVIYPHDSDWDYIADVTGDRSWESAKMRTYFERLENNSYRPGRRLLARLTGWNPTRHGFAGWLPTTVPALRDPSLALRDTTIGKVFETSTEEQLAELAPNPIKRLFRALKSLGSFLDPNDWRLGPGEGLRFTPLSVTADGKRAGTREYILETARYYPDRLHIKTGALVTKVLFDDKDKTRAVGVEYLEGDNLYEASANPQPANAKPQAQTVNVLREVILSGGAFNTPQLLKLSGIGPAEELKKHKIKVVADRPGVGENLQDRYEVGIVSEMREDFALLEGATFTVPPPGEEPDVMLKEWYNGSGPYTTNGAVVSMIKRSDKSKKDPDLFVFGLAGFFKGYYPGYATDALDANRKNVFTWAVLKAHTENRAGKVLLKSKNPRERPEIQFHYFEEGSDEAGEDLEAVVEGVKFIRRLNGVAGDLIDKEIVPGPEVNTRSEIREWVRSNAWGHHASCTAKIGRPDDPYAVVDSDFRVIGTTGLRVVDASVFPRIPGFFIVTPIYMISEKASEVIIADARANSLQP